MVRVLRCYSTNKKKTRKITRSLLKTIGYITTTIYNKLLLLSLYLLINLGSAQKVHNLHKNTHTHIYLNRSRFCFGIPLICI